MAQQEDNNVTGGGGARSLGKQKKMTRLEQVTDGKVIGPKGWG